MNNTRGYAREDTLSRVPDGFVYFFIHKVKISKHQMVLKLCRWVGQVVCMSGRLLI